MVRQSRNPIAHIAKRLTELEKSAKTQTCSQRDVYLWCIYHIKGRVFAFVKEKRSYGSLVCDVIHHNDRVSLMTPLFPDYSTLFVLKSSADQSTNWSRGRSYTIKLSAWRQTARQPI